MFGQVANLAGVYSRSRVDFRLAKLSARRESSKAQREERQQFIQTFALAASTASLDDNTSPAYPQAPYHTRHQSQKTQLSSLSEKDRQAVGASSRATEALREMHASLQSELERSEYANQTMTDSSAAFNRLSDSYNSLETMLGSSKELLGTLMRSQKSDTWYLKTTLYMLVCTLGWLAFRRFFYGPLWWLVWLPLRVLFGVGSTVGNAALQGSGKGEDGRPAAGGSLGSDGRVSVEGMPGKDLPTAQVGQDTGEKVDESGSMAEQVGRIIDKVHEADAEGLLPEDPKSGGETIHDGQEEARARDEL